MNALSSRKTLNRSFEIDVLQEPIRSPLALEVERALRATGYMPLRDLRIFQQGSTVILHGHVPTYHLKQLAQATAMSVLRVEQVRNEIEVVSAQTGIINNWSRLCTS